MKPSVVKVITLLALGGVLAGCVSPNGRPDYTGSGALIGAGSGAAIGALADRRAPGAGALIGGAAGAIAGGLIGHSMDYQAAARPEPPPRYVVTPQAQPLGIADIKAMAQSGVSDDVIISQINSTRSVYQLDANAIIDLKNAGVSQKVIAYMISTSNAAVVTQAPPPPPAENIVVAPGPGYTWVGGEWVWNGGGWVWIGGHWAWPPYGGAVWIGPRWVHGHRGWHRVGGYWH
ncbi:MAG: YXWGXW repeat-containing protein [Verrucomicrobia bacterium]|nr:YXWGXW repeat-containing protein [Verrucomicrobiota bacterium]